jgi:periplasmic protein TonB
MFGTLLESRAKRERGTRGTVVSVALHAGLIVLAAAATARATTAPDEKPDEPLIFVDARPPKVPPPELPTAEASEGGPIAPITVTAPPLVPPIDIPSHLPAVDLSVPETRAEDFAGGTRRAGERPAGSSTAGTVGDPMFVFQVDRPVVPAGGCAPRFPEILKSANVEGEVLAQFTVDAEGRVVDGTFKPLKSTHDLFTQAVRACLGGMRFVPAEAGGQKVAQLVQQPFVFALERR